mmetsp:Transcript_16750/g.21180  ORF Transcript_16750/g.21180 Transcript_16750/m.21180 type:complete len:91 (-) Transcript_16750:153-425(-)
MLVLSNLCLAFGTINAPVRMLGLALVCCLSILNFAALITTAVFRFNTLGSLAAISTCPTKFDAGAPGYYFVNEDWTSADEGSMILSIWVF